MNPRFALLVLALPACGGAGARPAPVTPVVVTPATAASAPPPEILPPTDSEAPVASAEPVEGPAIRDLEDEAVRDVVTPRSQRSIALLAQEAQTLEALLAATSAAAPDRPLLTLRGALVYLELAAAGAREGVPRVRSSAHVHAARLLRAFTDEHPDDVRGDEAFYALGLESERLGDPSQARKAYLVVIQRFPTSRLVPYVYFAFGELFGAEAASDPSKAPMARQAFTAALSRLPGAPQHPLVALITQRLRRFP